jgi:hypothetical protein
VHVKKSDWHAFFVGSENMRSFAGAALEYDKLPNFYTGSAAVPRFVM